MGERERSEARERIGRLRERKISGEKENDRKRGLHKRGRGEEEEREGGAQPSLRQKKTTIDYSYLLNTILSEFLPFSVHSSFWMQDA